MKFSKKLLSLFLAVVMVLSVFAVMATAAYETGTDIVNYKYSVEKVDSIPANEETGSEEYVGDDIYAVSLWMQSNDAITFIQAPVHFDTTHYTPVLLYAEGSFFGPDDVENVCYTYSYGDYMNNKGMYKADGSSTTKALAKCIGLGNSNSAGIGTDIQYMSESHSLYNKWHDGLADNIGVMKVQLDVTGRSKTAYFNTISGVTHDTGWNKMITLYFQRNEGVTDADCYGDEFGYLGETFGLDASNDLYQSYFTGSTTTIVGAPESIVVDNTKTTPVVNYTSQVRYTGAVDGDYAPFDIRSRAGISADEFAALCGDDDAAEKNITAVGFVYTDGSVMFDADDAKAAVEAKATTGAYVYKECEEIAKDTANNRYYWSCMVTDAEYEGTMNAYGFITVSGQTYFVSVEQFTDFNVLYDAYADNIPA